MKTKTIDFLKIAAGLLGFIGALLGLVPLLLGPMWFPRDGYSRMDWQNFTVASMLLIFLIALGGFVLYKYVLHKAVRLKEPSDVFKLRRPWLVTMLFVFLVQVVTSALLGTSMVTKETFPVLVRIVSFSLCGGVLSVLTYWLLSLFLLLPKRVQYVPYLGLLRPRRR